MGELICNGTTVTSLIYNGTTIAQQGVIQSVYDSYVSSHSYTNDQYGTLYTDRYNTGYSDGFNAGITVNTHRFATGTATPSGTYRLITVSLDFTPLVILAWNDSSAGDYGNRTTIYIMQTILLHILQLDVILQKIRRDLL